MKKYSVDRSSKRGVIQGASSWVFIYALILCMGWGVERTYAAGADLTVTGPTTCCEGEECTVKINATFTDPVVREEAERGDLRYEWKLTTDPPADKKYFTLTPGDTSATLTLKNTTPTGEYNVTVDFKAYYTPADPDELVASGDITLTFIVIKVEITPDEVSVPAGGVNVVFSLTDDSYVPGGVTWNLDPSGLTDGAVKVAETATSVTIAPGNIETNYTITAASVDNPNCTDTATLQIGCDCTPGERVDVTLVTGDPPFDQPHHAWSVPGSYAPELLPKILEFFDHFGIAACEADVRNYRTFYAKRYINTCCPDKIAACWGQYRYESERQRGRQSVSCKVEKSLLDILPEAQVIELFKKIEDYIWFVLGPDTPATVVEEWMNRVRAHFASLLPSALGTVRMLDSTNDHKTNESDECEDCPPPVPDCWTGVVLSQGQGLVDLRVPRTTPVIGWILGEMRIQIRGNIHKRKRGSRIGLQNKRTETQRSRLRLVWRLPGMRRPKWYELAPADPPPATETVNLCM